ncbi:chemotaxis protein CheW [Desulfonatronum thioautotrophicum]|uniref:chemotaxis protein CheW n=1 Tax=Desulfonatronum thioautotrophicum TaxID=617001 RepID=UPI0005EAF598|nr:chemotaxis protein CheW [Desulfonatronum thioautotrophicum]
MEQTFVYKDVRIPKKLEGIINHMGSVESYREELHNLGNQWDLLTILGQMSGTGTDMSGTREGFAKLTSELLVQLALETLKKTVQDIGARAQVAVDIVIRNLFERTADIGFLATDDDIRDFLKSCSVQSEAAGASQGQEVFEANTHDGVFSDTVSSAGADHASRMSLLKRFQEYVAKYSVYFNIILLNNQGRVLMQLDQSSHVSSSKDPLLLEALTTTADYVEVYQHSDLVPGQDRSLIYAYRVSENNDKDSQSLGVLCLCFRLENEMEGIFANLRGENDWSVMTILDKAGEVIASSDVYHIPLGARLPMAVNEDFRVVHFAGRSYLAKTCATKGYQGFSGLGWFGHVMLPLAHAFEQTRGRDLRSRVDEDILRAVLDDPRLFSEALRSIPLQAERIQRELERTVWNGNVRETDSRSKVLLWNISDAGGRTKQVFEQSINNLHETVVSAILDDVEFQAALSVDIMDRNLYERANDCRWWALTSAFRRILAQPTMSDADTRTIAEILGYINGLYTVYTNLFVYDRQGRILAVSNPSEVHIVGTTINADWMRRTLALGNSQQYSVSSFEKTRFYANRPTYIYGAVITSLSPMDEAVGGIGIVFDSEPQFASMLQDSLPRDERGAVVQGCFGVFADRNRTIISSTHAGLVVGSSLPVDEALFSLKPGEGRASITIYQDHYYAVGARCSSGYREYKAKDGYINDVIGMVFVPLASVVTEKSEVRGVSRRNAIQVSRTRTGGNDCIEVASFFIGDRWLGINADHVLETINPEGITVIPGAHRFVVGKIFYQGDSIPVVDIRRELRLPPKEIDMETQIILAKAGTSKVGLLVDGLGEIPEVCMDRVEKANGMLDSQESYVECVVKPETNSKDVNMLVVLDPERLVRHLVKGKEKKPE